MRTGAIRVLVVDDSALMRQLLAQLLGSDPGIEVVGTAADAARARERIVTLAPDVMTLDVEMPGMDGLTFLQELMDRCPMPVVMVSSLTAAGCATTLRALELGAVDFVAKPAEDVRSRMAEVASELVEKIKIAAAARVRRRPASARAPLPPPPVRTARPPAPSMAGPLIAVGASTGGPEALREFLAALPPDAPGVLVVQHMPVRFTRAFADRLDGLCAMRVKEAEDGDVVAPGRALIAPGDRHMRLARAGAGYCVRLDTGAPRHGHRPAVDVLFGSCAEHAAGRAIGVLMTGMGEDGARGLLAMRRAGAFTLAQSAESCVVYGMPKSAAELGAVDELLPLGKLAPAVLARACGRGRPPALPALAATGAHAR